MSSPDLFDYIRAAFTKAKVEGTPPIFMINRFLVSIRDYAPFVKWASLHLGEPHTAFGWWQTALPRQTSHPRVLYPTAKVGPKAEPLVAALMVRYLLRRDQAEDTFRLVELEERELELANHLGVEYTP